MPKTTGLRACKVIAVCLTLVACAAASMPAAANIGVRAGDLAFGPPSSEMSAGHMVEASVAPAEFWAQPATPNLVIGESGTTPTVDGLCDSFANEYGDATQISFNTAGGYQVVGLIKHTSADLHICLSGLVYPDVGQRDGPNTVVYIDRLGQPRPTPDSDHFAYMISYHGAARVYRGSRDGGFSTLWPNNYQYYIARHVFDEPETWSAEFRISRQALNIGRWDRQICIAIAQQWVGFPGDDYGWPAGYGWNRPNTWECADLTTNAPSGTVNLSIRNIEVTQAIQGPGRSNNVPLVAGKRTFVRLHVTATDVRGRVRARLRAMRGGIDLGTLIPGNPGGAITIHRTPNRALLNDSFWFELPASWTVAGPLTLFADLNPTHNPGETSYSDNSANLSTTFVPTHPLRIRQFDVRYTAPDGRAVQVRPFDQSMLDSWLRRAYPINSLLSTRPILTVFGSNNPLVRNIGEAAGFVNGLLARERGVNRGDPGQLYVGMVDDANMTRFMRGLAPGIPAWEVATSSGGFNWGWDFDGSYADWYGGHEIGHAMGRPHVGYVFAGSEVGCGAEWSLFQEAYPYEDGTIGGPPDLYPPVLRFFGFDVGDPALGLPISIIPPAWKDVMGYCHNQWVSDFTYTRIRNHINSAFPSSVVDQSPQAPAITYIPGDFLAVYGTINSTIQSAQINVIGREPQVVEIPLFGNSRYEIRLLDDGGSPLGIYPMNPVSSTEDLDLLIFGHIVDFAEGTRRVSIYSGQAGAEIGGVDVSPNTPVVRNASLPNGTNIGLSGRVKVTWEACDADGDPLAIEIRYRRAFNQPWTTLALGITGSSYMLEAAELEGTAGLADGTLRVIASDGVNTGNDDVGGLLVTDKPPTLQISSPGADQVFGYGQTVALNGFSDDLEDGPLPDASLFWHSNLNGDLGTGSLLHPALLSPGMHTITLTGTDLAGNQAQAYVTITILDDADQLLPTQPTIEVGPSLVDFFVTANTTFPYSQRISLHDLFGSTAIWNAESSATWLTMDKTSGTLPDDLLVSIDPDELTVLQPGIYEAHVTIQINALEGNTPAGVWTVKVMLQLIEPLTPLPGGRKFYLPLVLH